MFKVSLKFFVLIVTLSLFFVNNSFAQKKITVKSSNPTIVSYKYDNATGEFITYETTKDRRSGEDRIELKFYDRSFEKLGSSKIKLKDASELKKVVTNNNFSAFKVIDEKNEAVYFYAYNKKAERVGIKFITSRRNKALEEQVGDNILEPQIFSAKDGFYLVSYFEHEHEGYIVKKVDEKFNTLWGKIFKPVKRGELIRFGGLQESKNVVNVCNVRTLTDNIDEFKLQYYCLDAEEGTEKFSKNLERKGKYFYPNYAIHDESNNIVLAGLYYNQNRYNNNIADGIFVKKFKKDGTEIFEKLHSYSSLFNSKIKDFNVTGILENSNYYSLIIESSDFVRVTNINQMDGEYAFTEKIDILNYIGKSSYDLQLNNFNFVFNKPEESNTKTIAQNKNYFIVNDDEKDFLIEIDDGQISQTELIVDLSKSRRASEYKFNKNGGVIINDTTVLKYNFSRNNSLYYLQYDKVLPNKKRKNTVSRNRINNSTNKNTVTKNPRSTADVLKRKLEEKRKEFAAKNKAEGKTDIAKIKASEKKMQIEKLAKEKAALAKNKAKITELLKQKSNAKNAISKVANKKQVEDYTEEELKNLDDETLQKLLTRLEFKEKRLKILLDKKKNKTE